MEQQDTHQITAKTICDAIGRQVIADRVGKSITAVSNASVSGKFPASWHAVIRDLCAMAGHPCPDEAFSFIDAPQVPLPSRRSQGNVNASDGGV